MTRPCPVRGEPVPQRTGGRPAIYCSPAHRREVERLRRTLPDLELETVRAEQFAAGGAAIQARRHQADRLAAELADARRVITAADARR